jgi:hypothetical protein
MMFIAPIGQVRDGKEKIEGGVEVMVTLTTALLLGGGGGVGPNS